jgi:hypothetical protein
MKPKRGATWGGLSTSRPGHFTPRTDPVPTVQEAGWTPGPAWTVQKISPPQEFGPRAVQPVANRYTDYAIPARFNTIAYSIFYGLYITGVKMAILGRKMLPE